MTTTTSLPIFISKQQLTVLNHIAVKGLSGLSIINENPLAAAEIALLCMSIAESGGNVQLVSLRTETIPVKPNITDSNVIPFIKK